jgi:hypothetical protein
MSEDSNELVKAMQAQGAIIDQQRQQLQFLYNKFQANAVSLEKLTGILIGCIINFGKDNVMRIKKDSMMKVKIESRITATVDPKTKDLIVKMEEDPSIDIERGVNVPTPEEPNVPKLRVVNEEKGDKEEK